MSSFSTEPSAVLDHGRTTRRASAPAGGIAALVLGALSAILVACGSEEDNSFEAHGTVVVGNYYYGDNKCAGTKGISEGDQVVIMDGSGREIALGQLALGENNERGELCQFDFSISDVPAGESVYKLKISAREAPSYTEDELAAGVMLSFGDKS